MRSRLLVFTVGGLVVAAILAGTGYWFLVAHPRGTAPASVVAATITPTPAPSSAAAAPTIQAVAAKPIAAAAPSPATTPAFDVVRVEPSGDAVVAGRAAPGAQVELGDDGKAIGAAAANDAGQFVILPTPLSPGRHPLRLSATLGGGAPQVSEVVVVEVAGAAAAVAAAPTAKLSPAVAKSAQPTVAAAAPAAPIASAATAAPTPIPAAAPSSTPIAVATPVPTPTLAPSPAAAKPTSAAAAALPATSAAASVAPTPAPSAAAPAAAAAPIVVVVASVRPVDPAGLEAVGAAPPGAHVRLRLNNAVLAEVVAGADGEWRLTIERGVTPGDYNLEAAVVDAAGAVLARAESPFVYPQREVVASAAPAASPSPSPADSSQVATAEPTPAAPTAAATAEPRPSPTLASPAPPPAAIAEPTPATPAPSSTVATAPALATPAANDTSVPSPAHAVVSEVRTYSVVKGDNLWDLAIKYYGDGLRYADIFSANASQIRNPNLIYVGQLFVVPPKPTTSPTPAR